MNRPFVSASLYLWWRTAVNRARMHLRRAREPRYAVGLLFALSYLALGAARSARPPTPADAAWTEAAFAWLGVIGLSSAWAFGGDDAALAFTEAEIQAFFPGPVRRRELVWYKVARTCWAALPYALLATVFIAGRVTWSRAWFFVGAWIGYATLDLHLAAASATRGWLAAHGLRGRGRRALMVAVAVGAVGLGGVVLGRLPDPPRELAPSAWASWGAGITTTGLGAALTWPVRAWLQVALAPSSLAGVAALPAALGVWLAHVAWLSWLGVSFEDGTLAAAEHRSTRRTALRGAGGRVRFAGWRLPMPAVGPPVVALVWKGWLAAVRLGSVRVGLVLVATAVPAVIGASTALDPTRDPALPLALLLGVVPLYLALFGGAVLRTDLRLDQSRLDLLRSYPLSGRSLFVGEVLAPWSVLAAFQVLTLVGSGAALVVSEASVQPWRVACAVAACAVSLPLATAAGLVVQNASVLYLPEGDDPTGVEAVGRRLLTLVTNLVVLVVVGVPMVLVGAPMMLLEPWLGPLAWPLAALVGALPAVAALVLAVGRIGRWIEAG